MPRTKQFKRSVKPKQSDAPKGVDIAASSIDDFNKMYETMKKKMIDAKNAKLGALKMLLKKDRLDIPVSMRNKKIRELREGNFTMWNTLSSMSSISMLSALNNRNNTQSKNVSDEGYLTSESSNGTSGNSVKKIRKSRSLSRSRLLELPSATKRRETRSSSRTRNEAPANNKYKTPVNNRTIPNVGMVTPKIKPNTPHVVLRRPQQGEIAISLHGSPLMTTAMVTETTANLNIPLPDGRLINIQPMKGLRPSEIPKLDPVILKQLKTLKENLDSVCLYSNIN